MFNTTLVVKGRLARDPELRYLPNGTAVCSIAVVDQPRKFNKETKEWEDQTPVYWDGSVWRETAENVAENLSKGDTVVVLGRPVMDTYNDREGNPQKRLKLQIDEIAVVVDKFSRVKVERAQRSSARAAARRSAEPSETPAFDPYGLEPPF